LVFAKTIAASVANSQIQHKRAARPPNFARRYGPWSLSPAAEGFVGEIDANANLVVFPSRRDRSLRRFDPGE
jgi:hypothetical protein